MSENPTTVPKLVVRQPGLAALTVAMTRTGATTWTATVTPKKAVLGTLNIDAGFGLPAYDIGDRLGQAIIVCLRVEGFACLLGT